jgi:hypothetical protein
MSLHSACVSSQLKQHQRNKEQVEGRMQCLPSAAAATTPTAAAAAAAAAAEQQQGSLCAPAAVSAHGNWHGFSFRSAGEVVVG